MQPQNKEAREKYEVTQKEFRLQQLAQAIVSEDKRVEVSVDDMVVEASYEGPKLESADDVTAEWVVAMMEWQKAQKRLHRKFATMIILRATELFEKDETLVDICIEDLEEITVCGDVHGQYYDLLNIFAINGNPSEENPYLFNGDFIDRGSFSVEVVLAMLAWKVCFPQHFFMSRGNHEAKQLNKMYGFEGEVRAKYDVKTYDLFSQLFCFLPLCHVINHKVMVTHGGLFSQNGVTLADIKKTNRRQEPPDSGIMCELLWSDPQDNDGRAISKRGVGTQFGPDIAAKFLDQNKLSKRSPPFADFLRFSRNAGAFARGQARGLRVLEGRPRGHRVQRAQLLRPDGQQGSLHTLPGQRHGAQNHLLRQGRPPQRAPDGLRQPVGQLLLNHTLPY